MIRLSVLTIATLALAACGGPRETAEKPPATTVDAPVAAGGAATATTMSATTPAPAGDFFAPMAGSTTVSNMTSTTPGGAGAMVAYETANAPDAVIAHHKAAAVRAGYKESVSIAQGETRTWSGMIGPDNAFSVTAAPAGAGKTQVVLTRSNPG